MYKKLLLLSLLFCLLPSVVWAQEVANTSNSGSSSTPEMVVNNTQEEGVELTDENWSKYKEIIDKWEDYTIRFSNKSYPSVTLYKDLLSGEKPKIKVVAQRKSRQGGYSTPIFDISNLDKLQVINIPVWDFYLKNRSKKELEESMWCLKRVVKTSSLEEGEGDFVEGDEVDCNHLVKDFNTWMYYTNFVNRDINNFDYNKYNSYYKEEKEYVYYIEEYPPLTEEQKEEQRKRFEQMEKEREEEIKKQNNQSPAWDTETSSSHNYLMYLLVIAIIAASVGAVALFIKKRKW